MKNKSHHRGLLPSPYEVMVGCLSKVFFKYNRQYFILDTNKNLDDKYGKN